MIYLCDDFSSYNDNVYGAYLNTLPTWRRERALRYRKTEDGKRSALAFMLLRYAMQAEYGIAEIPTFSKNEYGKPYFTSIPVAFNLTHCKDAVAAIVADTPVGIDAESIACFRPHAARMICSDEELARLENSTRQDHDWTRLWTEKEAISKFEGHGLAHSCKTLEPAQYRLFTEESADGRYILTACLGKADDAVLSATVVRCRADALL